MRKDRIAWRRLSRGLFFVGFGTFLLLTTQGLLRWSFWLEAVTYWPVALVALGIRLIFERSSTPWAILASPLLVLGTLTYVALGIPSSWPGEWEPIRADRPADVDRWSLEGTLALVNVDLTARPLPDGLLVEGRTAYPRPGSVTVSERRNVGRVRIRSWRRRGPIIVFPRRRGRLDLGLSDALPLDVNLDLAFAQGRMDLSGAPVSDVDLEGAFNDLTLELGAPESDVRVDLEGAFNRMRLIVPATTPVQVIRTGFLNYVDGRREAASLEGPAYRLRLDGAFSRVEIRSP